MYMEIMNDNTIHLIEDNLEVHFVPCIRKTDGRVGFYIKETERFVTDSTGKIKTEKDMKKLYKKLNKILESNKSDKISIIYEINKLKEK